VNDSFCAATGNIGESMGAESSDYMFQQFCITQLLRLSAQCSACLSDMGDILLEYRINIKI
jgi:hypothetical protein